MHRSSGVGWILPDGRRELITRLMQGSMGRRGGGWSRHSPPRRGGVPPFQPSHSTPGGGTRVTGPTEGGRVPSGIHAAARFPIPRMGFRADRKRTKYDAQNTPRQSKENSISREEFGKVASNLSCKSTNPLDRRRSFTTVGMALPPHSELITEGPRPKF